MKRFLNRLTATFIVMVVMSAFIFTGCEKDDPEDFLGSISVQLQLKEGLSDISLENVNLSLINTQDNSEKKMLSDVNGKAQFLALPAGTYNLNISEPREDGEYMLTGTLNNIVVSIKEETSVTVTIDAVISNVGLVIKEIYYPGAADSYVSLFKDQFIEIYNNASEVIYADGLYIASMFPDQNSNTLVKPISEYFDITKNVYAEWVYQIPGTGKSYPIEPSKSLIIALNAMNFKEGNPNADKAVNNTGADLEIYAVSWLESQGRVGNPHFDFDNPDVPNVDLIYIRQSMNNFAMELTGPGMVIANVEKGLSAEDLHKFDFVDKAGMETEVNLMKIPVGTIIDGVDILENSTLSDWKRLPESVDASFNYLKADGFAVYSGLSLRRKIDQAATTRFGRTILMDVNNSFIDFEVISSPDPRGYNN